MATRVQGVTIKISRAVYEMLRAYCDERQAVLRRVAEHLLLKGMKGK